MTYAALVSMLGRDITHAKMLIQHVALIVAETALKAKNPRFKFKPNLKLSGMELHATRGMSFV